MSPGVITQEFVYEEAPFPSCHAATIVETKSGMLVAFFGGTKERHPDVCIWTSRKAAGKWSPPVAVADGVQEDGSREPTWNPVLFQPKDGPVMLFYKVGPSPSKWWGMVKTSHDDGRTWSPAKRLAPGILGPIKNKPVQLPNGDIVAPTSVESPQVGWRICFERSVDGGRTWMSSMFVEQDSVVKSIQPSVLIHSPTKLQAIGRTKNGRLFETWSSDAGQTWSQVALTELPNPNSGTDAVTLKDGRHVLAYNHSAVEKVRVPLNVAISTDGKRWQHAAVLEDEPPGQYSYPSIIQSADGRIHVVYTWKRLRIKHAVIDPAGLRPGPMPAIPAATQYVPSDTPDE